MVGGFGESTRPVAYTPPGLKRWFSQQDRVRVGANRVGTAVLQICRSEGAFLFLFLRVAMRRRHFIWVWRWLHGDIVPCESESLVLVNGVAPITLNPRLPLAPNFWRYFIGTRRSNGSGTGITEWGVIKTALAAASCEL